MTEVAEMKEIKTHRMVINTPEELRKIKKGAWLTILQLTERHKKEYPKEIPLLEMKRARLVSNNCFLVEPKDARMPLLVLFGAKVMVQTSDLVNEEI